METKGIQSTFRVTLPSADARFLKRLSENMGWQVMRVPAAKEPSARKEKMTEAEFRTKLARSRQQAAHGEVTAMQANETGDAFIQRLLCTR